MKKIYLILIIAIILTYILSCYVEKFEVVGLPVEYPHGKPIEYKSLYDKSEKEYDSEVSDAKYKHVNCCLIENKFVPIENDNNNYINSQKFTYTYTKLKDDMCDMKLYDLNMNKQLFIDGEYGWTNDLCKETKTKEKFVNITPTPYVKKNIGSCRYANKECINFIDKETCTKLNLDWSEKSCYEMLPFVFKDKVAIQKPKFTNGDGTVDLFPSPDVKVDCLEKSIKGNSSFSS